MKKIILVFSALTLLGFTAFIAIDASDWNLTDEYSIRFKGKKISGFFHTMRGKISFDENKLSAASVNLEIDAASIATGNSLRTWNSKRKKWFDAKKHPKITFASTKFQKTSSGFLVNGKLKIKGVEKDIAVPFSFNKGIFYGSFYVKRTDFNVGKMKGLQKRVGDTIWVDFTIPVKK